ncbi:aminoglycoside phosphotransferase family protein [Glycomyces terrestris]|uniref:Aminoglycoside phosphotransferase family protein n=2 Tax=Glycomyces terrestris TaxID=2493553 RepID=A0A426UWW9_9ACTN|nr:aminoglycoside phosphotransferase family protein [Glycomyces terrestris]
MGERELRELLQERHPDLAGLELKAVDGGWDNQMWRLGADLAVRLPRSERAPALLEREYRLVPELASRLPLPVPVPVRLSGPSERFPRTWLVTTWVHGTPADVEPVADPAAGVALASFLRALHVEGPAGHPANDGRGAPLAAMSAHLEEALGRLPQVDGERARTVWKDALAAPDHEGPGVWLHGDLHPANVVVEAGGLAGVVDFGDLFVGDPAVDLAAAWILLPDGAAEACLDAYGADEPVVRRARGRALAKTVALLEIGIAGEQGRVGGKPTWMPAAEAALARILA